MKWKIDLEDFFPFFLTSILVVSIVLGIIRFFVYLNTESDKTMLETGEIYIQDISKNYDLTYNDTETVNISEYENYDVFRIIDHGYSFDGMDNFELYASLSSPLNFVYKNSLGSKEIDYKVLFDAIVNEKTYEDIGILDNSLSGQIVLEIYGNQKEKELIKKAIYEIYPDNYFKLEKYFYSGSNSSNNIKISFGHYLKYANLHIIKSNLPNYEARFDLYRNSSEENTIYEISEIAGMNFVEDFSGIDVSKLSEIPEKVKPKETELESEEKIEKLNKETVEENSNDISDELNVDETLSENENVSFNTGMFFLIIIMAVFLFFTLFLIL